MEENRFLLTSIAQLAYLMLNPDFQPCPPFQLALTEEFIKWVWLGLKTVI